MLACFIVRTGRESRLLHFSLQQKDIFPASGIKLPEKHVISRCWDGTTGDKSFPATLMFAGEKRIAGTPANGYVIAVTLILAVGRRDFLRLLASAACIKA